MSRRVFPAWVFLVLATTTGLAARQAPAPAVTVVGFFTDSTANLSSEAIGAMTDKVAVDLVESGRFRVMDREWLGAGIVDADRLPIAHLRNAAKAAGVDYLVIGRITRFTERPKYVTPPNRTSPSQLGARVQPFRQPFAGYPMTPARPVAPARPALRPFDYLRVRLEIVDANTGSVVTETSSTCPMPVKTAPRMPALMLLPVSPIAAAVAAITSAHRNASVLDPGIARAVTTAGQVIARWSPPDPGTH